MVRSLPFILLPALFLLASGTAHAGPYDVGVDTSSSERHDTRQEVDAKKELTTFGLCDQPQDANALPTQPVPAQESAHRLRQGRPGLERERVGEAGPRHRVR